MSTGHRMLRLSLSVVLGGAVAFGLFVIMTWLVTNDETGISRQQDVSAVSFIHYEQETETRTKERREAPEEPPEPPPPTRPPEQVASLDQQARAPMPEMDMPNMDIDMGTGGEPFIGDFSSGGGGIDTDATPVSRVPPQYPREARRDGVQGYVTMEFTIRPDGSVTNIEVVDSHPEGVFEEAATRALSRWKFEPREEGGQKVSRRARQTIRFTLGSG